MAFFVYRPGVYSGFQETLWLLIAVPGCGNVHPTVGFALGLPFDPMPALFEARPSYHAYNLLRGLNIQVLSGRFPVTIQILPTTRQYGRSTAHSQTCGLGAGRGEGFSLCLGVTSLLPPPPLFVSCSFSPKKWGEGSLQLKHTGIERLGSIGPNTP